MDDGWAWDLTRCRTGSQAEGIFRVMALSLEPRASVSRPSPLELAAFLPYASAQLQAPYRLRVQLETQEEYVSRGDERSKRSAKSVKSTGGGPAASSHDRDDDEGSPPPAARAGDDDLVLTAVRDAAGYLVELALARCEVPRLLMQVIALSAPLQPLLARLTVRRAPLGGAALHEIAELLPLSNITELVLDDSPVRERNYGELLERDRLRRLSLARCDLDDDDCAALAERLRHPRPAARGLRALSLAANAVGDVGAAALGAALRSNRALRHLDLAGNRVADDGARALLLSLAEFPLTDAELADTRRRLMERLRRRRELRARVTAELAAAPAAGAEEPRGRRRASARSRRSVAGPGAGVAAGPSSLDALAARAEALTEELLGADDEPFARDETVSRDGRTHSLGNATLCSLSLAYNGLGAGALAALLAVLRAQAERGRAGLLRVVLEGNPLPAAAPEYALVQELLEQAQLARLTLQLKRSDKPKAKGK